jgi:hypothetical protein
MFSDESHIELQVGNQGSCCRRPEGSYRFEMKLTKMTVKHPSQGDGLGELQLDGAWESGVLGEG